MDQIPKAIKGTVAQLLDKKDERKNQTEICKMLGKSKNVKWINWSSLSFLLKIFWYSYISLSVMIMLCKILQQSI